MVALLFVIVRKLVSDPHTKDEIRLSQERRDGIINYLLEWLTGDQIDSKTLGHFRFLAEVFGITSKVKDMVKASSIQGRQELAVTVALAALNVALDDSPLQPTERQEARAAAKQFEQRVAVLKSAGVAGDANPPVKPDKSPSIFNRQRSSLSPEELERVRKLTRERQARYRAKLKAEKSQIG